ncbi:MAG: dihydropteroate synthase-like protein [Promethearchaeota archaeon]
MRHEPRILLLTGRMAYYELEKIVSKETDIFVEALPISVAAFTTPALVRRHLPDYALKWSPDMVLVSGMAQGDYSEISLEFDIPVLKGTKKLTSVPLLLKHLGEIQKNLSSSIPADAILQRRTLEDLRSRYNALEREVVYGTRNFRLKSGLAIGIDLPPRIMAELVDASTRDADDTIADAKKYAKFADILDIGASISNKDPERVAEITQMVRKLGIPVSIDSLDPEEITASVDAGAEMVLSIDSGNIDVVSRIPEDVVLVCLPTNVSAGEYPHKPDERARRCHKLCDELRKSGHSKLLADPVLEAAVQPGLMSSLVAFHEYRLLDQDTPFLAGFANVTEFLDSDSLGVNAILSCLGTELGISVYLTTEERPSTFNCVKELRATAQLAFIAGMTQSPPKELGITAFAAKSSTHNIQSVPLNESYEEVTSDASGYKPDPRGCFRIGIDFSSNRILCEHRNHEGIVQRLSSKKTSPMLKEILNRDLVGSFEHAAYLGAELARAEIALQMGHDYQQDEGWSNELTSGIFLNSETEEHE